MHTRAKKMDLHELNQKDAVSGQEYLEFFMNHVLKISAHVLQKLDTSLSQRIFHVQYCCGRRLLQWCGLHHDDDQLREGGRHQALRTSYPRQSWSKLQALHDRQEPDKDEGCEGPRNHASSMHFPHIPRLGSISEDYQGMLLYHWYH